MSNTGKRAGILTATAMLMMSGLVLADITVPHSFTAGTSIKAAEVNANFTALNTGKQDKLVVFTHVATALNTSANYTFIDNPATNANPNAILVVTPNKSPVGGTGQFYYGSVSVQYDAGTSRWGILHDKGPSEPVQVNEAFNILVLK